MSHWSGGRASRVALLGLVVLAVLGGIVVVCVTQVAGLKLQLTDRQRAIQTLTAQNQGLQQELTTVEAQRRDVEERLKDARGQLALANGELAKLRASVTELQERFDALTSQKSYVDARVMALTQERNEIRDRVHQLEDEKADLKRTAVRLQDRFAFLDRDYQRVVNQLETLDRERRTQTVLNPPLDSTSSAMVVSPSSDVASVPSAPRLTVPPSFSSPQPMTAPPTAASVQNPTGLQTVELPPIVVRKDQAGLPMQVRGRVVEVEKTQQFVVVDQGSSDGVLLGMVFNVMRGTTTVGRVRVARIRAKLSACDILGSDTTGLLQVGDVVVQQKS